jgi:hypothetical protein
MKRSQGSTVAVAITVVLIIVIAYLPYIVSGGSLMIDDWLVSATSFFQGSVSNTFRHWNMEGGSGMRPLASLLFAVTPPLFGTNAVPYILLNTACWLGAIFLFSRIVREYHSDAAAWWFVALGSVPTIASSTIFEPIVMIIGSSSILLWAVSLTLLNNHLHTGKTSELIAGYSIAVIGLLIYEVGAPLLLITALLPLVRPFAAQGFSGEVRQKAVRYGVPIAGIIVALALFQKLIVPLYGISLSRLSARPLGDMARSFGRWFFSIAVDAPVMIVSSVQHYGAALLLRWDWWLLVLTAGAFVWFLRTSTETSRLDETPETIARGRERRTFVLLVVLTLFACSALSVFSGFNMRVEGIENRFLGSSWMLIAVLLAVGFARLQRSALVIVPFLVLVLTYFSFMIQADNYVANRVLQTATINDCLTKIQVASASQEFKSGAFIVGNVPIYATNNFNNEVVFAYRHDFGGQLQMRTQSRTFIEMGQVINVNREAPMNDTTRFFLARSRDTILIGNLTGLVKKPVNDNVWWYEYDQRSLQSRLLRIRDTLHFDSILTANRAGSVNIAVLPVTERFRNSLKGFGGKK